MNTITIDTPIASTAADAVVIGVYEDEPLSGPAAEVDAALGERVSRLIESKEISARPNKIAQFLAPEGIAAGQLLVVGLGKRNVLDRGRAFEAAGAAAKHLATKQRARIAMFLTDAWPRPLDEAAVAGAIVGSQGQDLYRAERKLFPPEEFAWSGVDADALRHGEILGDSVNLARELVNEPPARIYPESLATIAADLADHGGMEAEVWDETRLEQERCGALLAVGQASERPPRLVILRHHGGAADAPWLALVGKGVTFDSGGLSIKPSDGMLDMKMDMAGSATVIGAMQAIARLELPANVMGVVGLVENLISGRGYKLGDVLTARNGRTIEVHNTDAEGRLVLADVLCVAVDAGASKIVDLATLTGACVVALGNDVAGVMTNDQPWCDTVSQAAQECGELLWPLPMFELYNEQIESEVADIKNVGEGRYGGAITAAKFLQEFVGDTPWTHIDIAGPAFRSKAKPYCDAGASGQFVRTLVELARRWK